MTGAPAYTIDDYWLAIYRRKWTILLVTLASAIFAVFAGSLVVPRYEALSEFYVPQDQAGPMQGPEEGKLRIPSIKEHALVFTSVLKSKGLQRSVADKFPDRTFYDIAGSVDFVVSPAASVRVYVRDRDPVMAAAIANSFIDAFQEFHTALVRGHLTKSLDSMEADRVTEEARKRGLEDKRQVFLEDLGVVSLDAATAELQATSGRQEEEIRSAVIALSVANERIGALQREIQSEQENQSRARLGTELSSRLLADLRGRLADARVQRTTAAARLAALERSREEIEARLQLMPEKAKTLSRLDDRIQRSERDITHFERQTQAIRDEMTSLPLSIVVVLDRAEPPTRPVFPNSLLNGVVAGAAGLVVGVLYALFLDHLQAGRRRREMARLRDADWTEEVVRDLVNTA